MKYLLFTLLLACSGLVMAQPYPFLGYTIYDYLVSATHPNGCPPEYVTGLPDDSTWINMQDNSVMTGYFANAWKDLPGNDLLLEACFHHHNYSVRLILEGGNLSANHIVAEDDWTDNPWVDWHCIFTGCIEGMAASGRLLLPLDFGLFGIGPDEKVIGIEITFLPTIGQPDFAGAYIIVPPCGLFSLGPDTIVCPGETVTLDATTPNALYQWQDGSTNPIYMDAGPGTYWVKITIYDCSKTDTLYVIGYSGPPDLGDDLILCAGETHELDVTTPGATYEWQDNSTLPTYTLWQAGDYAVTVTIDDCEFTDVIHADYVDIPLVDLGNDTTLCDGFELLLNASTPGAAYEWQDQSSSSTFTVTEPGEYTVIVDLSGCLGQDMIEVNYTYPDPVDMGPDQSLCEGETLFVDAYMPGATYLWQDNSTLSDFTIAEAGSYWVVVEKDNCITSDTIEVEYTPAIILDLGNDTTLCQGASITLNATQPGATYTWQDQSTAATFHVTSTGDYSVLVEIGDCLATDTVHITFVDAINIQFGPDTTLCSGQSIQLNANTPGATLDWQDHSAGSSFTVTQPGLYWVQANLNGCTASDTIQVAYDIVSSLYLGPDTTLCDGETILLDASQTGVSFLWQDNSTADTFNVTKDGMYEVTVSIGHCSDSDTILVNYNHLPPIMLGNDTTLCEGETLLLETNLTGATLEWQDQSTASSFLVNTQGIYWVRASTGRCNKSDSLTVNYISLASIDLGPDTTVCDGQSLILDASIPGASYLWQDNSVNQTLDVNQSGTYWVKISLATCEVSDTIQIDFQSLPAISLGNDTTLCEGESLVLDATTNGASYAWQDQTTDPIFSITQSGTYWVNVSIGGCLVSDTIDVAYQNLPMVDLGNDTTLCSGEQLTLHADYPGATYEWQDHSTQMDFLVSESGEYSVYVRTDVCEVADTIHIAYLELSSINLGQDTSLCDGQSLTLQVNAPGAEYVWQDQSTSQTYLVNQPGTYWVQVSLAACATSDTIVVDIKVPLSVDLGADTLLCSGEELILEALTTGAVYVWQDHSTQSTYNVTQSGRYHVTLEVEGCMAADTIQVDYIQLPLEIFASDTTLCDGSTFVLDATAQGAQYEWQDHSTSSTFLVNQPGIYDVTLTIGQCTTSDTIVIQYEIPVSVDLGVDRTLCEGEVILLSLPLQQDVEYRWQDNSTASDYEVTEAGLYWVEVRDECRAERDSIEVVMDQCACHLFVSNVFTPNGDNVNDQLLPQASCGLAKYHLTIYDRFGGLLFDTSLPGEGWDGTVKSKTAQSGVYVYALTYAFEDGDTKRILGDVTLLR